MTLSVFYDSALTGWMFVWVLFEQHKANLFLFADLTLHFWLSFCLIEDHWDGNIHANVEPFYVYLLCGNSLKVFVILKDIPSTVVLSWIHFHHALMLCTAAAVRAPKVWLDEVHSSGSFSIDFLNFSNAEIASF
jgi:hypothetical protein